MAALAGRAVTKLLQFAYYIYKSFAALEKTSSSRIFYSFISNQVVLQPGVPKFKIEERRFFYTESKDCKSE